MENLTITKLSISSSHNEIKRIIEDFSKSDDFQGLAIAVISVQEDGQVHSTLRSGIADVNTIIGLSTLIQDVARKSNGLNSNTSKYS